MPMRGAGVRCLDGKDELGAEHGGDVLHVGRNVAARHVDEVEPLGTDGALSTDGRIQIRLYNRPEGG
jgi:hypothetical protein